MKPFQIRNLLFLVTLAGLFLLNGCRPDPDGPGEIPPDTAPQITLISPASAYSLTYRGETVPIVFRLDDNQELNGFSVTETWTSVNGQQYQRINQPVFPEKAISGNYREETVNYTVPTSIIQDYSRITLTATVYDNKRRASSATFSINVLPDTTSGTAYLIQEYPMDPQTGAADTIFSVLTGSKFAFSFINRSNNPPTSADYDIGEASLNPNFSGMINTPNQPGVDSTIVWTDATKFNYDAATYETIWQAFVTSNQIGKTTPALKAGDILLIKMVTLPHYAVVRILEKSTSGGFIKFEYKYTYQ